MKRIVFMFCFLAATVCFAENISEKELILNEINRIETLQLQYKAAIYHIEREISVNDSKIETLQLIYQTIINNEQKTNKELNLEEKKFLEDSEKDVREMKKLEQEVKE